MVPPIVILVLCIVAGIGTVLVLPGRREAALRKIGGIIALVAALVMASVLVRQTAAHTTGDVYFWIFSLIAVVSAVRVISHTKPVYSALYFVLTVVASAGLFVLLWAEFMAAALILIYAGAILVTYVFVIMLASQAASGGANLAIQGAEYDQTSREPLVASAVGFMLMGVILLLIFDKAAAIKPAQPVPSAAGNSIRNLASFLFRGQLVALELAGLLLTVAMVGAVVIAPAGRGRVSDARRDRHRSTAGGVDGVNAGHARG